MRGGDDIDAEVQRIIDRDGHCPASVLLEENTPEGAPIHHRYEWDEAKAAHLHRLTQSRGFLRVANVTRPDGTKQRVVHVPKLTRGEGTYRAASDVAQDVDEYARAMDQALSKLRAAQRAVQELEQAARTSEQQSDILGRITIALRAMETANNALRH